MNENFSQNEIKEAFIQKLQFASLTERERQILLYRFFTDDEKIIPLEELAEIFHVGKERIRQVLAKVARKLRHERSYHLCIPLAAQYILLLPENERKREMERFFLKKNPRVSSEEWQEIVFDAKTTKERKEKAREQFLQVLQGSFYQKEEVILFLRFFSGDEILLSFEEIGKRVGMETELVEHVLFLVSKKVQYSFVFHSFASKYIQLLSEGEYKEGMKQFFGGKFRANLGR